MSIKLTDTQLVMLSAAVQREDRCLVTPYERGSFYRIIAEGGGPVGPSEELADCPTSLKPAERLSKPRARRAA